MLSPVRCPRPPARAADAAAVSAVAARARDDDASEQMGFVGDPRRLNVAVSRARDALVVVGDARLLARVGGRAAPWPRLLRAIGAGGGLDGPSGEMVRDPADGARDALGAGAAPADGRGADARAEWL